MNPQRCPKWHLSRDVVYAYALVSLAAANDIISGAAGNGDRLLGRGSPTPAGGNQFTRLIRRS
ncbi:MAG: hypothetical protein GY856_03730 [bacterium]|nr:hypothetical protein [bacterium]